MGIIVGDDGRQVVPARVRIGYATGDFGISIAYFAFGFFFLFYLTDLVGLPPSVAGTVVLVGKLWDGVNDPLIGMVCDRTRSRHGRKRVYLLYGAVPFGTSFAVLWWIPAGAPTEAVAAMATALVLLFATTYSLVGVPYQALVPVITDDYDERTRLVGYKAVFSTLGAVLGGGIALVISARADVQTALRVTALVFAGGIIASIMVAARATREMARADRHPISPVPLSRYVRLAAEPNVSVLMGYKLLGAVATGTLTAALPFFAHHVIGSASSATFSLAIYTVFGAALVPVWVRLTRRYDKRRLVLVSNGLVALTLLGIAGLTTSGSSRVFLGGSALGLGVAGFVLGLVLQWSGYVAGADTQPPGAVLGVRLAFGLVPAVFLVAAGLALLRYRITRESLGRAQAANAAQGAAAPGRDES
ncbi:MAG: MFS transporter [Kineosporiaceae bacterium]